MLGDDQRFAARSDFRFRLQHIDRRHRADFHLDLVVPQQVLREVEGLLRHFVAAEGEGEIPVGVLHIAEDIEDALFELVARPPLAVPGHDDLPPFGIGGEVLEERLRDRRVQDALEPGVECGELAVRPLPVVVEVHRVGRSERELLLDAQVVVEVVALGLLGAVELGGRGAHAVLQVRGQRQVRGVRAPGDGDPEAERLPVQPGDAHIQVVFERHLHGVVEREFLGRRLAGGGVFRRRRSGGGRENGQRERKEEPGQGEAGGGNRVGSHRGSPGFGSVGREWRKRSAARGASGPLHTNGGGAGFPPRGVGRRRIVW